MIHVHSTYSFLQGTIPLDNLISHAKLAGKSYAVLTDTNKMNGLIQFTRKAEEENIKPILGVQLTELNDEKLYVILLAKNNKGYEELCRLVTTRNLVDDFSLINVVNRLSDNLFVITPCIELITKIDDKSWARKNLYIELIATENKKENTRKLFDFAKEKGIKFVASNPVYFETDEDYLLHKVVSAIRLNTTLANLEETEVVDPEYHFIDQDKFKKKWRALPDALWNINYIVQNCNVNLEIDKYKFPVFLLPDDETAFSYLWKLCFDGLAKRYHPITDKVVKRLQYELEVIDELGFCDYFLIVADIVKQAHQRRMMTIGRGSAANSLVAYCLEFTQVDPIEHNLYFERFLNKGRTSPPDVDLDFSWKERDEIVKYIYEKYGYDKVAMISTTVTFRARAAFRETAKVFGIPDHEISKYSKFIPWTSAKNLPIITERFPEAKSLKLDDEPWPTILKIASRLAGFPRYLSIHPSGIVITEKPITNYVALEYAANKGVGLIITQPDMYSIEDFGLIKIDLLSQRSLGVLRDTLSRIYENRNHLDGSSIHKFE